VFVWVDVILQIECLCVKNGRRKRNRLVVGLQKLVKSKFLLRELKREGKIISLRIFYLHNFFHEVKDVCLFLCTCLFVNMFVRFGFNMILLQVILFKFILLHITNDNENDEKIKELIM
jgi:hypothetical protein